MNQLIDCADIFARDATRDALCDAAPVASREMSERLASANRRVCEALSAFDAEDRAPLDAYREQFASACARLRARRAREETVRRELIALDDRVGALLDALIARKMLSFQSLAC